MITVHNHDLDEQVQEVIAYFDFEKVRKVMQYLNWTWAYSTQEDKIPSVGELVLHLTKLLNDAKKEVVLRAISKNCSEDVNVWVGCGGFDVRIDYWHESNSFTIDVAFNVSTWTTRN